MISRLDALLDRYGGRAAYGRKDQTSHAFLDHELDMLNNMSRTLPPIFLLVAAFLVNLTLTRLVALEREQIGLLKALGYGNWAIAAHYLKFVLVIVVGIAIGSAAGTWLGSYVTELFGRFFRFPFLVFSKSPDVYIGAAPALTAPLRCSAQRAPCARSCVLPPAVAMQPPAPPRLPPRAPDRSGVGQLVSQPTMMMLRNIAHHPIRASLHAARDGLRHRHPRCLALRARRHGASDRRHLLPRRSPGRNDQLRREASEEVVHEVARLPGVLAAEPYREVPVRIRSARRRAPHRDHGTAPDADLSRIIDVDLRPVSLPESGLAISAMLAEILGVRSETSSRSTCSMASAGPSRSPSPPWSRTTSASGA